MEVLKPSLGVKILKPVYYYVIYDVPSVLFANGLLACSPTPTPRCPVKLSLKSVCSESLFLLSS